MESYQILINSEEELKLLFEYTGLKWNSGCDYDDYSLCCKYPIYLEKHVQVRGFTWDVLIDNEIRCVTLENLKPEISETVDVGERSITVYTCGVDFQHEIGEIGGQVFDSIDTIKARRSCCDSCGIFECKLVFVKEVVKQDLSKDAISADQLDDKYVILSRVEHLKEIALGLREDLGHIEGKVKELLGKLAQ